MIFRFKHNNKLKPGIIYRVLFSSNGCNAQKVTTADTLEKDALKFLTDSKNKQKKPVITIEILSEHGKAFGNLREESKNN